MGGCGLTHPPSQREETLSNRKVKSGFQHDTFEPKGPAVFLRGKHEQTVDKNPFFVKFSTNLKEVYFL
jgi:hypothetical protein